MLAGRPPFEGEAPVEVAVRHLQDAPPPLPDSVPPQLAAVVEHALAKDPEQRYADGGEMASALAKVRAALPADPSADGAAVTTALSLTAITATPGAEPPIGATT